MVNLVVGVGQAGGAIVDEMFAHKNLSRVATPLAINSTLKDLQMLKHVPRSNWLGLSEVRGLIPGTTPGFEELVVGGFGKDPRLASEVVGKNLNALRDFFKGFAAGATSAQNLADKEWSHVEEGAEWTGVEEKLGSVPFTLLVLGLGGGTGCGASAHIVRAIREASAVEPTIIAVGVLPATHEASPEGARGSYRQAWNAVYALNELEKWVDGFILVDNERLAYTSNIELMFPEFNAYVALALNDLLMGHLLEGVDPRRFESLSLPVIDTRDIASSVSFGSGRKQRKPGYASIGWAAEPTRNLAGFFLPFLGRADVDMAGLFQLALRKQSIHGADPREAKKNLGLVRLPISLARNRELFPQTGLVEAELGKLTNLNETHFGITVGKRPLVSVNTLFTYERRQLGRLKQIQDLANLYSDEGVEGL